MTDKLSQCAECGELVPWGTQNVVKNAVCCSHIDGKMYIRCIVCCTCRELAPKYMVLRKDPFDRWVEEVRK